MRPDHLGDVLLASPAVELLRRSLPDAHLSMMVGPWSAELARRDPLLDQVTVWPFPGFTREPRESLLAPYQSLWRAAQEVRGLRYDAAVLLRFDHWWGAWMSALAAVPVRVGYGVRECSPFLTHIVGPPDRAHWAVQSLRAVEQLLKLWGVPQRAPEHESGLRFSTDGRDEEAATQLLSQLSIDPGQPVVVFHPGSGSPLKLWPEEHWAALGRALAGRGARVLVTGSREESAAAGRIAAAVPGAVSVAGQTQLGELAAIFRRCDLVVGVDNGPLHLAVAIDAPTVHLFGPTDPAVYGPWGDPRRHRVVAAGWPGSPCSRLDLVPPAGGPPPCMAAIRPEQVMSACLEVMGDRR